MNRMPKIVDRRTFIGGSDARIIMGNDELALLRLWQEKRGEVEPQDLSNKLIVQLGIATEDLNRRWYEANTGEAIIDVQRTIRHTTVRWLGATLDGRVQSTEGVFEAKFMLPWSFFGGSCGRETHGTAAAQYVGGRCKSGGALGHYRRRQMGRDQDPRGSALSASDHHR